MKKHLDCYRGLALVDNKAIMWYNQKIKIKMLCKR